MLSSVGRHTVVPTNPAIKANATNRCGAAATGSSGQTRRGHTENPGSPCRGSAGPINGGIGGTPGAVIVIRSPPVPESRR